MLYFRAGLWFRGSEVAVMGLINGVDVGFSQYDGVPVDTELHHSSTDLAISTITSKGFTPGLMRRTPSAPRTFRKLHL